LRASEAAPSRASPCDACGNPSVLWVPYSGRRLCGGHFRETVERRARAELRRQLDGARDVRVAAAVSGGKDSLAALAILHDVLSPRRDASLVAISVDEGVEGYRAAGLEAAARLCRALGVEHRIVRHADRFGTTTDAIVARDAGASPCAACGVLRRRALNDAAREVEATHVATGHNLDDLAQTILMNVARADVARLGRLGPHVGKEREGLVPRLYPLRTIPEREVALYAHLRGLAAHLGECPHSGTADRRFWRDLVLRMEDAEPGARHRLLAFHDAVAPRLPPDGRPLVACRQCGEPASGEVCRACAVVAGLPGSRGA